MNLTFLKRFKTLFYRPNASFKETIDDPSLLKTSVIIIVGTLAGSAFSQYGLNMCVVAHFTAAYSLMFTMLWLLPTLFSMLIFRVFRKKFSSESYIESGVLAFFPFFTFLFLYFVSSTVYNLWVRSPPQTVYHALVVSDQVMPLTVLVGIGSVWTFVYAIQIGRQVAGGRIYQSIPIWVVSFAISLFFVYLLFRGWL